MNRVALLSLALLASAAALIAPGCGGSSSSGSTGSTTPTVTLSATPSHIAPGGTTTLNWTSQNVSSVVSSSFGATGVSGSISVGPLSATTDYTITCTGPAGSASAHTTVVVNSSVTSIPSGVLLYSVQNASGTSTLFYQPVAGGSPVTVGTFASGVQVFGTDATGTRLVIAAPLASNPTKKGVFLTDLDGVSHAVQMSTDADSDVQDASITAANTVLVAWTSFAARSYTTAGVQLGHAPYGAISSSSVSIAPDAAGTVAYYTDRTDGTIDSASLPTFSGQTSLIGGGGFTWVRADPSGKLLVFGQGNTIYTIDATSGTGKTTIDTGSFPTFDNTGSRILLSKVGDGIYVKDLNAGSETRLVSIAGAWNGRIAWH